MIIQKKTEMSTISGISFVIVSNIFIQCPQIREKGAVIVYLSEIGTKLKELRRQRKISQITLAKQLGVSKSVISSYENEIHSPPYDVLLQMARLFGVSTDYLLGASNNRTINVDGLTDTQVEAITMSVNELRETNKNDNP